MEEDLNSLQSGLEELTPAADNPFEKLGMGDENSSWRGICGWKSWLAFIFLFLDGRVNSLKPNGKDLADRKWTGTRRLKESGFQNTGAGTGGKEGLVLMTAGKFVGREIMSCRSICFLWKVEWQSHPQMNSSLGVGVKIARQDGETI